MHSHDVHTYMDVRNENAFDDGHEVRGHTVGSNALNKGLVDEHEAARV